jgi:hypothetical protein
MNDSEIVRIAELLVREYLDEHRARIDGIEIDLIGYSYLTVFHSVNHSRNTVLYQNGDTIPLRGEVRLSVDSKRTDFTSAEAMYNLEVQIQLGEQPTLVSPPTFNPR